MQGPAPIDQLENVRQNSTLEDLMFSYPDIWEDVGQELLSVAKSGRIDSLTKSALKAKSAAQKWELRISKSQHNPKVIKSAMPLVVRSRMYALAMEKCSLATAAGKISGKVRFNLFNGYIIQKLLFERHLTRKLVSMRSFKFWWRFISQKKLLIPLLKDHGIYCFYSKELIRELSDLIDNRVCVEIGAGDGTLARFLNKMGAPVIATDDYSWGSVIEYPEAIERLNAKSAIAKYQPEVVICSWPPAANNFERQVFAAKCVDLYIVIGSRFEFSSGNWQTYASQNNFEWEINEQLSSYVIPPESTNGVLIFRRGKS